MKLKVWIARIGIVLMFMTLNVKSASARQNKLSPILEKAIGHYKHENYEEALDLLIQARSEDPTSTITSYYLGLTFKQLQNYRKAIPHLRVAVTFTPKIKGALIELIDCLYHYDKLTEAEIWLKEAEEEKIRPAQVAFLKGLVLTKRGDFTGAIASLQKASELDTSMKQAADYQIGIAHLKANEFDEAQKSFYEVAALQPTSSLAQYANKYLDSLARRKEAFKPWRLSFTTAWQYDDNVVLKPDNDAIATNITDQADWRVAYNMQTEYDHRFNNKFGIKGQYNFYYGKQNDLGFYNTLSNAIVIQPSLYFKKSLLAFPTSYNHTIVDDRSYLSSPSTGAVYNHMVGNNQMGQAFLRHSNKNFMWTPIIPEEDRDANEIAAGMGWYWFFARKKGFANLRYGFNREWTEGSNWEDQGHRVNVSALVPIKDKASITISASAYFQDFLNPHSIFGIERADTVYTASTLLTYKLIKDAELQFQYTFVRDDSNINVFSYDRNIYSAGLQVRF